MATSWQSFVELVGVILMLISAAGGSTVIIDKLKTLLKLEGPWALALSWAVTGTIAILGGIVSGAIVPEIFGDPLGALAIILALLVGTEKMYRVRKG